MPRPTALTLRPRWVLGALIFWPYSEPASKLLLATRGAQHVVCNGRPAQGVAMKRFLATPLQAILSGTVARPPEMEPLYAALEAIAQGKSP